MMSCLNISRHVWKAQLWFRGLGFTACSRSFHSDFTDLLALASGTAGAKWRLLKFGGPGKHVPN